MCERAEIFIDTKITRSLYTKAPEAEGLHLNDDLSFDLKKMFAQEGGIVENYLVDGMNYDRVIIHTHGMLFHDSRIEMKLGKGFKTKSRLLVPLFYKTHDNVMYTILEDAGLIPKQMDDDSKVPSKDSRIYNDENLIMCIQCEDKKKNNLNKTSPNFTILDEMFLNMYCEHVSLAIEKLKFARFVEQKDNRTKQLFEFCNACVSDLDHTNLQNYVEINLPALFECQTVVLFMLDVCTNTLYRSFGESAGIMTFPRNIGLTGQCMAMRESIVVKKMPNRSYKEEIDNVLNLKIGNMISSPLFNKSKSEVVGVIHIYNRERETTDVDTQLFFSVNHIIGCCIDNANQWARVAGMIDYDIKEAVGRFNINQEKYEKAITSTKKLNDFMNTRNIKRNRNMKNFEDFRVQIKQREYMLKDITKYLLLKSKKFV